MWARLAGQLLMKLNDVDLVFVKLMCKTMRDHLKRMNLKNCDDFDKP